MNYRKLFVLTFLFVLPFVAFAGAQEGPAPFLLVYEQQIKSGAAGVDEDYMKKIVEAANKIGSEQNWITLSKAFGGNAGTYMIALGFQKWEDVDSWSTVMEMLNQAFGEKEATQISQKGQSVIVSTTSRVFALSKEHCTHIQKYPEAPANLYAFTEVEVKPEMYNDYLAVLSQVQEAEEADPDYPMAIRRTVSVGETATFYTGRAISKFAEMGQWNQTEAIINKFGEHYARELNERILQCVRNMKVYVGAYMPELSRVTTPSPTEN